MKLKSGKKAEYQRRHKQIWPELQELLKAKGITEYRIFFDAETDTLFAFQELSGPTDSQSMGDQEVVQKWWDFMADIMETNPDNSPVSIPLELVFQL